MSELKPCPFGADHKVWIGVHDDEGNYHGKIGCEYESDAWSGISYGLHHEGWGDCPLCTDGDGESMGGMLFDTQEEAAEAWNTRVERTCQMTRLMSVGRTDFVCDQCDHCTCYTKPNFCPTCGAKVVGDETL